MSSLFICNINNLYKSKCYDVSGYKIKADNAGEKKPAKAGFGINIRFRLKAGEKRQTSL